MRKQYNEGYTLVLVMVVMVILCLLSMALLSFSLKNLQLQMSSVTVIQDRYEVQGAAEAVKLRLQNLKLTEAEGESAEAVIRDAIAGDPLCTVTVSAPEGEEKGDGQLFSQTYEVSITAVKGTARLECLLSVTVEASREDKSLTGKKIYTVTGTGAEYVSYRMSVVAEPEGGGSE